MSLLSYQMSLGFLACLAFSMNQVQASEGFIVKDGYRSPEGMEVGCLALPGRSQCDADEVAPLGFPIGKATFQQVKKKLNGNHKISFDKSFNGPVITIIHNTFGIQGLKGAAFVFNEKKILVLTELVMDKDRFHSIYGYMKDKYEQVNDTLKEENGDLSAEFKNGNKATISMYAKQDGYEMIIKYYEPNAWVKYLAHKLSDYSNKINKEKKLF